MAADRVCSAVDLDAEPAVVDWLAPFLDERERGHADARQGVARTRYVVAHGALRVLLAERLGTEPAAIQYRYSCAVCGSREHGRPEIAAARAGVSFSLSHSGDVGVVAIAPESVGVDVEVVRARRHGERVAERIMSVHDYARWRSLAAAERPRAFLREWTAKEAYLKLLGVGITRALRDVHAAPVRTWDDWPSGCVTSICVASEEALAGFTRAVFAAQGDG
jgi:4'-phosphopantetheinyl transferase